MALIAYRFLEKKWAQAAVTRGEMLLRLLSYYQTAEDPHIRDDTEGSDIGIIDFHISDGIDEVAARAGIRGYMAGKIAFWHDTNVTRYTPMYVMCLSLTPMVKKWPNKDTVLIVRDAEALAGAIYKWGAAQKKKISPPQFGPIQYTKRPSDLTTGDMIIDPFRKPEAYAEEQEYRIVFPTFDLSPTFEILCPEIVPLLEVRTR